MSPSGVQSLDRDCAKGLHVLQRFNCSGQVFPALVLWYSINVVTEPYEVISVILWVTGPCGIEFASSSTDG